MRVNKTRPAPECHQEAAVGLEDETAAYENPLAAGSDCKRRQAYMSSAPTFAAVALGDIQGSRIVLEQHRLRCRSMPARSGSRRRASRLLLPLAESPAVASVRYLAARPFLIRIAGASPERGFAKGPATDGTSTIRHAGFAAACSISSMASAEWAKAPPARISAATQIASISSCFVAPCLRAAFV